MSDDLSEDQNAVRQALCITRSAFPDIYAGAVQRIRSGASDIELDRFICRAISQHGIPLDTLEALGYGISLTAYGIDLSEPNLYTAHPALLPLVQSVTKARSSTTAARACVFNAQDHPPHDPFA